MASRIFLLCLLVSLLSVSYIECRGHSRGHSSSHSSGHSFGHSSGHSSGSSHSWGHSGSSSSHSYPSSSSGFSGSSGSHSYPSSSSGLSGYGSHSYPSGTGLSGSHSYSNNNYYSSRTRTFNRNSGHYTSHYSSSNEYYRAPSYYTAPEYVYIHEYRNSNSRYGDLLTGLSLYNYGRSQSHYRDHYYYDDYYKRRYDNSMSTSYDQEYKPIDLANCVLKVKENEREEVLKIPCEIVSTFTEGSKKVNPSPQTQVNKTVCTSTITTAVTPATSSDYSQIMSAKPASFNKTDSLSKFNSSKILSPIAELNSSYYDDIDDIWESINGDDRHTDTRVIPTINFTMPNFDFKVPNFDWNAESEKNLDTNSTASSAASDLSVNSSSNSVTRTVTTVNETTINVTVCTTNFTFVDPLTVQGPPVNLKNMPCVVEIQTRDAFLSSVIDCNTLVEYAKLPEPKKDTGMLPERQKLKSWLAKPPWWMPLFIAV